MERFYYDFKALNNLILKNFTLLERKLVKYKIIVSIGKTFLINQKLNLIKNKT